MSVVHRRPQEPVGPSAGLSELVAAYSDVPLGTKLFLAHRYWHSRFSDLERLVVSSGTVLDLGCGHGLFASFLGLRGPERRVVALEKDVAKATVARGRVTNVSVEHRDVTLADFPRVDAVTLIDVAHHLESFEAQEVLLADIARSLPRGGQLVFKEVTTSLPFRFRATRALDWIAYPGEPLFFRHHDEFRRLLEAQGFSTRFIPFWKGLPYAPYVFDCRKR